MSEIPHEKCHRCGTLSVAERTAPVDHTINGRTVTVEADRHRYCWGCGNITYRGKMLRENQQAIRKLLEVSQ